MDDATEVLSAARDAYRRRDWRGARERFRAAAQRAELSAADLMA